MTQLQQIKCDMCNSLLKDNEIVLPNGIINISNKPKSRYNIMFTYEGQLRKGDLCIACARKIRNYIEDIKEGKIK